MGGPWFAVHENETDWQRLGQVWVSNGQSDCRGVAEYKVDFVRESESQRAAEQETEAIAAADETLPSQNSVVRKADSGLLSTKN